MNSAWFLNHTLIYPHLRARGSLIWMTLTRSLSWRLHTSFWWDASLWYGELVTFVILQSLVTLHVTKSLFLKGQRRRSDCAFGDPSVQTYTVMARGHTTNVSRQMNECVYRDNSMHFDQPQWHSNTGSDQSAHPEVWLHVLTAHVSRTLTVEMFYWMYFLCPKVTLVHHYEWEGHFERWLHITPQW